MNRQMDMNVDGTIKVEKYKQREEKQKRIKEHP